MAENIIKGIPYFVNDDTKDENGKITYKTSLVQEIITFTETDKKVKDSKNVEVLIENIWDDLKSNNGKKSSKDIEGNANAFGTWKRIGKKYFYWEVEVTAVGGEGETVKQKIEAPTPFVELFCEDGSDEPNLEVTSSDSGWSSYWKEILKASIDNSEKTSVVTPKETVHHKSQIINPKTDNLDTIVEKRVHNPVDQTIETLINTLF